MSDTGTSGLTVDTLLEAHRLLSDIPIVTNPNIPPGAVYMMNKETLRLLGNLSGQPPRDMRFRARVRRAWRLLRQAWREIRGGARC